MKHLKKLTLTIAIALTALSSPFVNAANNQEGNNIMPKKIVQTAGRDNLGKFAPEFAHYNDDVLFGENWNNQDIDVKTRCMVTVSALIATGISGTPLEHHLKNAKNNGVTKAEIAALITQVAFYAGWPKAWNAFSVAKTVWDENEQPLTDKEKHAAEMIFPIGPENVNYAKYFIGKSYLAPVSTEQVKMFNVTFEPRTRNNWHIHHAKTGGGQMLIGIAGYGYYQEAGKEAVIIKPGDVIHIPANVKHWHGAMAHNWFSHIAVELDGTETSNEWLEPVTDADYDKLPKDIK